MVDQEKETKLGWILEAIQSLSLAEVIERLESVLKVNVDDVNLQRALEDYLGRSLSDAEMYVLRPTFIEIEDNSTYEEE